MKRIGLALGALALMLLFAFPLTVGATSEGLLEGYGTHDASSHQEDYSAGGQAEAFSYSGGSPGPIVTLTLYIGSSTTADEVILGVYSNNGTTSKPDSLLGECTISITSAMKGTWQSCEMTNGGFTHGFLDTPWLTVMSPYGHGDIHYYDTYYATGTGASYSTSATTLSDLPSSFGTTTQNWGNGPAEFFGGSWSAMGGG